MLTFTRVNLAVLLALRLLERDSIGALRETWLCINAVSHAALVLDGQRVLRYVCKQHRLTVTQFWACHALVHLLPLLVVLRACKQQRRRRLRGALLALVALAAWRAVLSSPAQAYPYIPRARVPGYVALYAATAFAAAA